MSRFLLISGDGDGLGVALRLKEEGHAVTVQIRNRKARGDYDGLLNKTEAFERVLTPDTIVLFDSTGGGKTAERLRAQGHAVFGASMFADQLELDRELALGLMEEAGILVPPSQHFVSWQDGIAYVRERPERYCFKSDKNKLTSYVASSPEDMIEFLQKQEKEGETAQFELQDFVKGFEISTEGWFDGQSFARPFNHTFEKKKLMNDDIGPSSGCVGNIVEACPMCRIVEEGILRFEGILRYHGYVGCIDLNTICNEEGVWGLEWTPRLGYDAFPALMEMLTVPLADIVTRYARGGSGGDFPMNTTGYGAALRVSIPPYPCEDVDAPRDVAIRGLVRADRPHAYFYNVVLDPDGQLRSSGAWGATVAFTGFGETIPDAMGRCEEMAKRVELRDKQFRTDLTGEFIEAHAAYKAYIQPQIPTEVAMAQAVQEAVAGTSAG